jgi:hypothetical protein
MFNEYTMFGVDESLCLAGTFFLFAVSDYLQRQYS